MVMLEMAAESERTDGATSKCQSSKLRVRNDMYTYLRNNCVFTVARQHEYYIPHAVSHKANGSRYEHVSLIGFDKIYGKIHLWPFEFCNRFLFCI